MHAYVAGTTSSTDFPAKNPIPDNGTFLAKGFLTKLGPSGSIEFSSILPVDKVLALALDPQGKAYLTGLTGGRLKPTANALQAAPGGQSDAFVLKMDLSAPTDKAIVYSTYIGGKGADLGAAIAVDASGSAYIAGTAAEGLPAQEGGFPKHPGRTKRCLHRQGGSPGATF